MEEFISLLDVYPTVLDYAGTSHNDAYVDGRSIRPLLEGAKTEWRDQIVVEFNGVNGGLATLRTIRYRNFKYGFSLGWPEQLYDLDRDPDELNNLAEDEAFGDVLRDMRTRLVTWMEETGDGACPLVAGAVTRATVSPQSTRRPSALR
jgi:choline-sulfatase